MSHQFLIVSTPIKKVCKNDQTDHYVPDNTIKNWYIHVLPLAAPKIISKNTTHKKYNVPQKCFRLGTSTTPADRHISIVTHLRKLLKHTY